MTNSRTSIRMKPKYARRQKEIAVSKDEWGMGYQIHIDSELYGHGYDLSGVKRVLKNIGLSDVQIRKMKIGELKIQGIYRKK